MSWKRKYKGRVVQDLEGELWIEIEELETVFNTTHISNYGRVKRVNKNELFHRKNAVKEKLLTVSLNNNRKHKSVKFTVTDSNGDRFVVHRSLDALRREFFNN